MSVRICHYNARRTLDLPYSALDLLLLSQPQPEKKRITHFIILHLNRTSSFYV